MIRRVFTMAMVALLSGCAWVAQDELTAKTSTVNPGNAWLNVEVASLMVTKKTIFDHVATWVTGRDCSSPRAERNGAYCVEWPAAPAPPAQVYCYASIARATCYAQPYNQGNDRLIGFVPASAPIR